MSPELTAALRLLDEAKASGFVFQRLAPGEDAPLWGVRDTLDYCDRIFIGGFGADCHAFRQHRSTLVIPSGLPITERVEGDALTVLHAAVWDWGETEEGKP